MKPRIAASSYLNSAPLIWSFIHGPRQHEVELTDPVPSRCAELLANGEADAALVPVIEYQRIGDLSVVPDVCVGSRREVRSVVLASKTADLRTIKRVALDESSRTSATLIKIIFREFVGVDPVWTPAVPDLKQMLRENDAALIIGDPGMTFARAGLHVFDMAALWRQYTGFGFVFAMWMIRGDAIASVQAIDFGAVRDEGLLRIDEIVSHYEARIPLTREELTRYLTDNITFHIDDSLANGLRHYFTLAEKHGLIAEAKPLRLVGQSVERF